ncbi:hypothetical protein ACFOZ7_22275 [Natribaculum luteum]|uniref:ArsR family transcriptional regulator n=1 Tax=Natribaculum luteum TaxID=1586232 RepID=A0ABD5P6D4_9EURY|nr:hypothetical protein [Natribaculum luteum]
MANQDSAISDEHLLLDVLGDSPRIRMLAVLIDYPDIKFDPAKLADYAGLDTPTVQDHLPELRRWGLVKTVGAGQQYQLDTENGAAKALQKVEWEAIEHYAAKEDAGEVDADNNPVPQGNMSALDLPDLPDDSIFRDEDYVRMYRTLVNDPALDILKTLAKHKRMSIGELAEALDRPHDDLPHNLWNLKRVALIREGKDPNTGREEPYSYYSITDLGRTVLDEGVKEGVRQLAQEEDAIQQRYYEE